MFKIFCLLCAHFISFTACYGEDKAQPLKEMSWSFEGVFGMFDRSAIQRGLKAYQEVCSTCHSMKLLSYRHLEQIGYTPEQVKAFAKMYEVTDGPNDEGQMFTRVGLPTDAFISPYPNEKAARAANNGAFPADLSLIVKARKRGASYVYSLLTGFENPPAHLKNKLMDGMYYNSYFPGEQIAMAPPLVEGLVTYQDGTKATIEQIAEDVTTFLAWAAEPEMEMRKKLGFRVILFLLLFASFLFLLNARIWRRLK